MPSGLLPRALAQAISARLEGASRKRLAERAAQLSAAYRRGETSSLAVVQEEDLAAYLVVRMPATYAAIHHALERTFQSVPEFEPLSLADVGCGPGTAAHAALDHFPGLDKITLVDSHPAFLKLARTLGENAGRPALAQAETLGADMARRAVSAHADLVIAGYMLAELEEEDAARVAERLWAMTDGVLVVVEPGTPGGFARIRQVRNRIIALGGIAVAPCPHAATCPIVAPDWCHFSVRVQRSRDHMIVKGAEVPFEDERFAYIALAKASLSPSLPSARILAPVEETRAGRTLKLCTPRGLETRMVPVRDKDSTRAIRRLGWGDGL